MIRKKKGGGLGKMLEDEYFLLKKEYEDKIREANEKELKGEISYTMYKEICEYYNQKIIGLHDQYYNECEYYEHTHDMIEYLKYKLIKDYEHMHSTNPHDSNYYQGFYDGVMSYIMDLYQKCYGLDVTLFTKEFETLIDYMYFYDNYWGVYNSNPDNELDDLKKKWLKEENMKCHSCTYWDKSNWKCSLTNDSKNPQETCNQGEWGESE